VGEPLKSAALGGGDANLVVESYTCRSCGEVHAGMPLAFQIQES